MAGNPFDAFDAKPAANPFDAFDAKPAPVAPPPATPAASAGQDLGTTALWNKPADVGWNDYLLAHLAKPFQGADQAAQDYSRTAVDAATFGLGDRFQSYLTGNPLAQERAQTAAASGRLGAMAPIVQGAMYAAGPGELGIAKGLGEAAAPAIGKWAGGVLGSGIEGAGAGLVGAAGHDENPNQGMAVGGALGALGGVPGGVVGRGGALAAPRTADDLKAAAKAKYDLNDPVIFDGPGTVHPAFQAADAAVANANLTGQQFDLAKSTKAALSDFRDKPQFTATDLDKAQGRFDKIASSPNSTDQDKWIAPYYSRAIEDVMQNGTPFNAPTKWAADTRDAADKLHGMAEDTQRLNDWITRSKVSGGPDVGDQARAYMLSKGTYARPGTPGYDELNRLAGTGAGQDISAAPSAYDVRHGLHPLVSSLAGGAAMGAGSQIAEGHFDPAHLAAETLAGAALGYGVHRAVPAFQAKFFQQPAQQRAIDAYRVAASIGQPQMPVMPTTPLRDMIRTMIYGQGAGGRY